MGYTHYWKLNKDLNEEVLKDVQLVVEKYRDLIQYEADDDRDPEVSPNMIRFNGIGDNSYETFLVEPHRQGLCKTGYRPYDIAVCEVLLVLKHHYGDDFELKSDGFWVSKEDYFKGKFDGTWNKALENVKRDFGYEFEITREIIDEWGYKYYNLRIE